MRVRKQDANGDYVFGHGNADFLVNVPAAVGQLVQNTLDISEGEWFLDNTFGTPWWQEILDYGGNYDTALQGTILAVPGVTGLPNYSSTVDPATRKLTVTSNIDTAYGQTSVSTILP
jgi:hypothetical protein